MVLYKFQIENEQVISTPLATHFKLSVKQSPSNEAEEAYMSRVPQASAMGSLMYATVCTRLDIAHVGITNQFLSNLGRDHQNVMKWILRNLHGTVDMKLCFEGDKPNLVDHSDSYMAKDIDSKKSTLGYLINFARRVVAWQSRFQWCVALSTKRWSSLPLLKHARSCYG